MAFGVAGIVIVLLIFGLAFAIGMAKSEFVARLRTSGPRVKRWGGIILIIVGLWSITIGIWADFFAQFFPV